MGVGGRGWGVGGLEKRVHLKKEVGGQEGNIAYLMLHHPPTSK